MEHPSTTTPAATGHGAEAAQQRRDGRNEGAAMEPPPPGTTRVGFQGLASLVRRDKDMTDDPRLERRDTAESCLSDFNIQRTNTDFSVASSVASSVATDMTVPNSPDVAFADECPDSEAEGYASSSRRSNLFPHPMHFQKRMPSRAPSIPNEADKLRAPPYGSSRGTPSPQHRRLGQMASRKSSLNVSSSPTTPAAGPSSQREPSPPSDLKPLATDPRIRPEGEDNTHEHAGDGSGNGSEPVCRTPDMSHTPIWGAHEDTPQDRTPQEGGAEDRRMWEEDTGGCSIAKADDEPSTPGPSVVEAGSPTVDEAIFRSATPRELRPMSSCSEARDTCEEEDAPPTPSPDDRMILEVCEQILQHPFGVQLHELPLAGALSAVYESVRYCLAELSHIVHDSGLGDRGIVISESTRGASSSGVPIWPAEGVASSVGSGSGGSSQGQGNGGGGRKRSNGAESGDGTGDGSPGGGKRQKFSANAQPTANVHFSCPFRKRNPVKFNIREWPPCAMQSFPDFSLLKRHVKNFHKQTRVGPFTCLRCRVDMGSQEALRAHLSVARDQICNFNKEPSSADPEDGITLQMEEVLNGRKADRKIDCWGTLWRHLFPHDVEVPESDFIPPTELDEVYAEFSSNASSHQLRQCIRERLGPADDGGVFSAVWSHIEAVFEACRAKTGSAARNRRRGPPQMPRQMSSLQASVRLNPGRPALGSQGSGSSDSSISSPVATPTSSNILGNLEQPSTVNPQLQMPYAPPPPVSSYPGVEHDVSGAVRMAFIRSGSVAGQGGGPIMVAPPAHVHPGFNNQAQETVGVMGSQVGHPTLAPMDSGMGLNCSFSGQDTGDFTGGSPFGARNDFANEGFVPTLPTDDLCLRLLSHGTQEIQGQMLSPTDPSMVSGIPFYNPPNVQQKHFGGAGPSGEQWR